MGSHDNSIYVYDYEPEYEVVYRLYAKFSKHSSFITAMDFSLDGKYIRSVCGAYELLFFNLETKKQDTCGAFNTTG